MSRSSSTDSMQARENLTINERILLHLLENHRYRDEREAPQAITQRGIADSVGIRWNHVPRAVSKLKRLDYVSERLSHIEGKTRRQKAYYLTDEGLLSARGLRERVMTREVYLRTLDGKRIRTRLSKINTILKTQFTPLQLIASLSEDGTMDAGELLEGPQEPEEMSAARVFVAVGEMAWPEELIGRESEVKKLTDWMGGGDIATAVIYGSVGIGKSALMAHMVQSLRSERHIFWYQMSDEDTQEDILNELAQFLIKIGSSGLESYLKNPETPDLKEALKHIEQGLARNDAIFAFDNYNKVCEGVVDLFSGLSVKAQQSQSLKLLINAMDTTPFYCRFYDKRDVKKRRIAELTLKGLDMEGSRQVLETPNIDSDALRKIHLMTRGHPLTLLLVKRGDVNSLKRVKGFTRQEASLLLYLKGVEKE